MSEHPIVACHRGLDSADAVAHGALLAGALDEPLVLASAYRYVPPGVERSTIGALGITSAAASASTCGELRAGARDIAVGARASRS